MGSKAKLSDTQVKLRALPEFRTLAWLEYFAAADKWDKDAKPWLRKWRSVPSGLRYSMVRRFKLGPRPTMPNVGQYTNAVLKLVYLPGISDLLNRSSPLLSLMRKEAA